MSKVHAEPIFILKTQEYKESSLIVECFSQHLGRFPLLARGARRPRADIRGQLSLFAPLKVDFFGRGDLKTLSEIEWIGGLPQLAGESLLAGFYLNELLLKLLPREDAHESLFLMYANTIAHLAHQGLKPDYLRAFEWQLLQALGVAPSLDYDLNHAAILPHALYSFSTEQHAAKRIDTPNECAPHEIMITGKSLLTLKTLATHPFTPPPIPPSPECLKEIRQYLKYLLDAHLNFQRLITRDILHAARAAKPQAQIDF